MLDQIAGLGSAVRLLLVVAGVAVLASVGGWCQVAGGPLPFEPPPSPEVLKGAAALAQPHGVVILSVRREYSGTIEPGFRVRGTTTTRARFRYYVSDAHGVENINKHRFFSEGNPDKMMIMGRTTTPDGRIFDLDTAKDIREMDVKDSFGRNKRTVKTAFFPHVEPGCVLDLSYSISDNELPDFAYVPLQYEFHVVNETVVVDGSLYATTRGKSFWLGTPPFKVYWVPFFTGPVPPRCHAKLSPEFDLDLSITDAAALPDEMAAPPAGRVSYGLGLMPRLYRLNKESDLKQWHQDLILFGPGAAARKSGARVAQEGDIDPSQATVSLDALALQTVPSWSNDASMMTWWQEVLGRISARLEKFFRRDPGAARDLAADAEKVAPPAMPWKERARALFNFVRSRVKPDPDADDAKTLARLLHSQGASERDLDLLYIYLCEKAGLQARVVLPMSRSRLAFTPILESFRTFSAIYMVEVSSNGEEPLYVMPGDVFANFDTFPSNYLGALAFRQPLGETDMWPMFRMPAKVNNIDNTVMAATAPLEPLADKSEVRLEFTLEGSAAWLYRWDLGWKRYSTADDEIATRMKKTQADLVDSWSGLEWEGALPVADHRTGADGPLNFSIKVPAHLDIQEVGGKVIAPCLLRPYLAANFFREAERIRPLWLPGGTAELSLSWEIPAGIQPEALPPVAERTGPGGLYFRRESTVRADGGGKSVLTTRMTIAVPDMLPASDYQAVRSFFEELKSACETKLLFDGAAAPVQEKHP